MSELITPDSPRPASAGQTARVAAVHAALVRKIESGLFRPGERFLSARALAQRYRVSYQTADRLLGDLHASGHLVRRARSGTFIPGAAPGLAGVTLVFHARAKTPDSFGARLLKYLKPALRDVGAVNVRFVDSDVEDDADPPEPPAARLPVVWNCPRLAHAWARQQRRVVLVNDRPDPRAGAAGLLMDAVGVDDLAGGALAADLLLRLNRDEAPGEARPLVIVAGPEHDRRAADRAEGFRARWGAVAPHASHASHASREPRTLHAASWSQRDGERLARRVASSKAAGLFCGNDRIAQGLVEGLRALGKPVPPIVGFDDAPVAERLGLTTIAIPWAELARAVRQVVRHRLSRPSPAESSGAYRLLLTPVPVIRTLGFV